MKRSNRLAAIVSSVLAVLVIVIGMILIQNKFHQKQYFLDNIQWSLVELQGILAMQEETDWDNPQLVSNQLQILLNNLWYGLEPHTYPSKALNEKERNMLVNIGNYLQGLPNNDIYSLPEWSKENIENARALNEALIEADLKMNTTISMDWKTFIKQCEILETEFSRHSK